MKINDFATYPSPLEGHVEWSPLTSFNQESRMRSHEAANRLSLFQHLVRQVEAEYLRETKEQRSEIAKLKKLLGDGESLPSKKINSRPQSAKQDNLTYEMLPHVVPGSIATDTDTTKMKQPKIGASMESSFRISPAAKEQVAADAMQMRVLIESARGLPNNDSGIKGDVSDPYVVCEIVGKPDTQSSTGVVFNSLDPVFNHTFNFDNIALGDSIRLTVYDKEVNCEDCVLGTTSLECFPGEAFEGELKLACASADDAFLKLKVIYPRNGKRFSVEDREVGLWAIWRRENVKFSDRRLSAVRPTNSELEDSQPRKKAKIMFVCRPESYFRVVWDILGLANLMLDLVWLPVQVFDPPKSVFMFVLSLLSLSYWTLDMVASCITMYYKSDGNLESSPRKIVLHYLRTWFLIDFGVVLTEWLSIILVATGTADEGSELLNTAGVARTSRIARFIKMLRVLRIMRLAKLRKVLYSIQNLIDAEWFTVAFAVSKNIITLLILNHLLACAFYWVGYGSPTEGWPARYNILDTTASMKYVVALGWSMAQFTPGATHIQPGTMGERIFGVFVLVLGLVVATCFMSSITSTMASMWAMNNQHRKQSALLRKFLKQNNLPRLLSARIVRYVELALAMRYQHVQESKVQYLDLLSGPLLMELKQNLYEPHLAEYACFKQVGEHCWRAMRDLCAQAISCENFAKNELIFSYLAEAHYMFFVKVGSIAYRCWPPPSREQETMVREVGTWCVEPILFMPWEHRGDMKALSAVELISVSPKTFGDVVLRTMEAYSVARTHAFAFWKRFLENEDSMLDVPEAVMTCADARNSFRKEVTKAELVQARLVEWSD
eukprot:TRINITY_DN10034_c0_g1_i1.p1 TRINITY_DN10034_c0_g1~~TRINITY_DN10034_c0_g1_i1.p1  ORF type:complete len:835 (+),score=129.98 TRINITY_DN10034_c0_g1_i1:333-2837(+)